MTKSRENNETLIIITERACDIHACIKGHPEIWGCGSTNAEAIGNLINSHKECFNINIEFSNR